MWSWCGRIEVRRFRLYFYGSFRWDKDTYGAGAVLFFPDGRLTGYGARNDGSVTASHHAAYEAILLGMFMARMRQVDSILIMSNEQSVIKQMRGEIPVHSERIIKGYKMAKTLQTLFPHIEFQIVTRSTVGVARQVARIALYSPKAKPRLRWAKKSQAS